ncbi:hypothetical protein CEXT_519171 [Caerostris extrusa]|uniref:Uncharacterized protein n=1 Tax=Caerostris extrusa TaxID=172846 RepID=A0AAV4RJP0_CAEEX|nr:hypothetical protein CEXT_519171 [Caerostris extrusa]
MYRGISVAHFCQRLIRGDSGGRRLFSRGGDRNDQQVSPCSNRDYFYTAESVLSRCVQGRISESTDWTPGVRGSVHKIRHRHCRTLQSSSAVKKSVQCTGLV